MQSEMLPALSERGENSHHLRERQATVKKKYANANAAKKPAAVTAEAILGRRMAMALEYMWIKDRPVTFQVKILSTFTLYHIFISSVFKQQVSTAYLQAKKFRLFSYPFLITIAYRVSQPYACNQDFRFALILVLPMAY